MAKERVDRKILELRKLIAEKKLIVGTERTIKALKLGKLEKVFLSSNCRTKTKEDVKHYSKLSKAGVSSLRYPNDELGVLCKKPYSISVLGLLKGKS
ncbi:ribosomal L7Ae/L30e/S12e/Gadd45 family protein [Candidatus Woesearchaeota archaeon]|nr:ribosomal L7Ae/L30e/S12e/Gadd45 family protein [Candidatus Woesearchaeota archaeon]